MKICLFILFLLFGSALYSQYELRSPNSKIGVRLDLGDSLKYSIQLNGRTLISPSVIGLELENRTGLTRNLKVRKISKREVRQTITAQVPEKRKFIPDYYNELSIQFSTPFRLEFRAYDDGVAYRILTAFKDSITVKNELAEFRFATADSVYLPVIQKRVDQDIYHTSFEEPYSIFASDKVPDSVLAFSPVLYGSGPRVVITESDIESYPGMFLRNLKGAGLEGHFAPYPLEETMTAGEFPQMIVTSRAPYIARIKGTRALPWRVMVITEDDRQLPENDLVYRLASPSRVQDVSWIQPGKATDEWIIGIRLFNIPFKAGINTATYKYYIDFAKRFGFDRIMMDAGWSDYKNLFKINPDLDMDSIAAYARQQNIRLSMWTLSLTLEKQLDSALKQFRKWGVDFIMTDFMDRDDQKMVDFYHRIAEACAREKIMIMYHGAFKPAGFNRTWPNSITREGVLGSEYNIWSAKASPEHDLQLPFVRMVSGAMDYEPGLLANSQKENFRTGGEHVMSQGTRCHQLAMFVVFDSPMQIFSGNPSQGLLEPQFMELMGSTPTTWDTTVILKAKMGDYIVTARKKGKEWFIAGMNDWTPRMMEVELPFGSEEEFELTICSDGINADRMASDYHMSQRKTKGREKISISMAAGGGFLIRCRPGHKN